MHEMVDSIVKDLSFCAFSFFHKSLTDAKEAALEEQRWFLRRLRHYITDHEELKLALGLQDAFMGRGEGAMPSRPDSM